MKLLKTLIIPSIMILILSCIISPLSAFAAPSAKGYVWPLQTKGKFSQGFVNGHGGIDIGIGAGSNVIASMSGTVKYIHRYNARTSLNDTTMNSYGNLVILYHPNGTTTYYAHLKDISVSLGQSVSQGQVIGHVGLTGATTGYHLHFELRTGASSAKNLSGQGTRQNPLNYVNDTNIYQPIQVAKIPTINSVDVLGGKRIEIVNNENGATVHYTTDGKTDPTANSGYTSTNKSTYLYNTWAAYGVRAMAAKSGMNPSGVTYHTSTTGLTADPRVLQTNTASGATIELKSDTKAATIFYTTDGTAPTFNIQNQTSNAKKYTGAFSVSENCTIKAIAVASGMRVSSITEENITCVVPEIPKVSIENNKIAQGDSVKVSWERNSAASSYTANLYKNEKIVDTQTVSNSEAHFILSDEGTYQIGVSASNIIGKSEESELISVESIAPLTVRFMSKYTDEKGQEVSRTDNEQKVKYGSDAIMPSDPPSRRGYTFAGWDGQLKNITENTDIFSTWKINEYKVKFYAADGKTVLSEQNIKFYEAATPPSPGMAPTGKIFSGWAVTDANDDSERDYNKVDSDMVLRAVFAWEDEELPVIVEITDAQRNAAGNYTINVKLTNYPTDITTALLRVALKTADDKLVQTSKTTVEIGSDDVIEKNVILKYNGDYIATIAEVEVVGIDGNYRTGGAYSKAVKENIRSMDNFYYTEWSDWSTTKVDKTDDIEVEEAVQYRFRNKQYTKSTATSLVGWERTGKSDTTYGAWSGNQTTTNKPSTSDTLQQISQSTKYTYYRYCNYYDKQWQQDSIPYGTSSVYHEISLSSAMKGCANKFADKGGKAYDLHGPYSSCSHKTSNQSYWWTKSIVTTYVYQTRSKTITYEYYKWDDWNNWSFDEISGNDDRQVEKQTVYRYRTKKPGEIKGVEDKTGTKQTISGKLSTGTDLSGKEATIMVYNVTNSDPNEDQMQYIGQTVIGSDNSYSFSFIPRQDPSADTGDYIVALGVKGATGLVNVATIPAPKSQYSVVFQYVDSNGAIIIIDEQKVNAGEDAVIPETPVKEGCQFLGWSRSVSNVDRDMVVTALFTDRGCSIVWVDYVTEDVILQNVAYGSDLQAPSNHIETEGYTFKGWDALLDGKTKATEDMVITAVYDTLKHVVMFVNYDGSPFKTVQVNHGEAAPLPEETPTAPEMEFVSWGTTSQTPWWCVTTDLVVKPLFAYEGTVSSPFNSAELASGYVGVNGVQIYLETPTENATILYTTDGSQPTQAAIVSADSNKKAAEENLSENESDKENGITYIYDAENGINIKDKTTIRAMACLDGMNDSSITDIPVEVTSTNDIANAELYLSSNTFYLGDPVEPGIMVFFGDDQLEYDKDYTVVYENNTGIGSATATVSGKGDYTGRQVLPFEITAEPEDNGDEEDNLQTPSLSATLPSMITNKEAKTYSVAYTGNGIVSVISSDTSIIDVSYNRSNSKLTLTPKKNGNATITISSTETAQYKSVSKTYNIKVLLAPAQSNTNTNANKNSNTTVNKNSNTSVNNNRNTNTTANKNINNQNTNKEENISFKDVKRDDWYYNAVKWASNKNLLTGYSGTNLFGPNDNLTRAQAAVILWRWFEPEAAAKYNEARGVNKTKFSDNLNGKYYTQAINWAYEKGIFTGYEGTNLIGVNDSITRQQMCTVIYRCATKMSNKSSKCSMIKYNTYPDKADVASYATDSVAWCLDKGVISGWDGKYIAPTMELSRSQMAQIMMNTINNNLL